MESSIMAHNKLSKVDLHLHSWASNVTDYYTTQLFSIPESYSDPIETYWTLKKKGMDLVTLTDHNSIDGILEILDKGLPDAFISSEMTTTFPEDGCNVHVTIINMTETQFKEVDRLRGNIYEMLHYVNLEIKAEATDPTKNKIEYFVTHPLMSTQNRPYGREGALSLQHIEKLLLLCNCLEIQNGTRTKDLNLTTGRLLKALTPEIIERLANKHNIEPKGETPWLKTFVGGSDDHSGINPGETYTTFPVESTERATINDLIQAIRNRATTPKGAHGGPVNIAHAMVKIMYHHQTQKATTNNTPISIDKSLHLLLRFAFDQESISLFEKVNLKVSTSLRQAFAKHFPKFFQNRGNFEKVLNSLALELVLSEEFQNKISGIEKTDEKIFMILSHLVNRIFQYYIDQLLDTSSFNLITTIKEGIALVFSNLLVSLPYFISYHHQSSERPLTRDVRKAFNLNEKKKVLLFTDTFFEINGVSKTIRKMITESGRRNIDFTVVTCLSAEEQEQRMNDPNIQEWMQEGRLKIFTSIKNLQFPEYKDLQIHFPPLLELVKFAQEGGFTAVQISTPGTIGLAGLAAAKLLQIQTSATYHTCFPEYVENYTKDVSLEAIAWKYMILFYHTVDEIVVPSQFVAKLLHERGLRNRKFLILDRWVDHHQFHPQKQIPEFWKAYGFEDAEEKVKFIYVGRVAIEKDLYTLAEAYKSLCHKHSNAHLIVVGDGPYTATLKESLAGFPATFTGFLKGEKLAQAYASADVKVFPSSTDTWGNSVLEAQASGLPVIVSNKGGPQELIDLKKSGFKIRSKDIAGLTQTMEKLLDPDLRKTMSQQARQFILDNTVSEPYSAILDSEGYRARKRLKKMGDESHDALETLAEINPVKHIEVPTESFVELVN